MDKSLTEYMKVLTYARHNHVRVQFSNVES